MTSKIKRTHSTPINNDNLDPPPEPTFAEKVKTLVYKLRLGTLSTISSKHNGWPFGSLMPYGLDHTGGPTFLISTMAMHTYNIINNPRASLLITNYDNNMDPLGASRVTLMGEIKKVKEGDIEFVRKEYLSRYDNANYWVDFDDFSFYRMKLFDIYYVGGFGEMGWVSVTDYNYSKVDPLADNSRLIIEHMNKDHGDSLKLIVQYYGKVHAGEVELTSVDRLGFNVKFKSDDGVHSKRIAFIREVNGLESCREMFIEMVNNAREKK